MNIRRELWAAVALAVPAALALSGCSGLSSAPYKNAQLPVERRVDDLMSRMTQNEKLDMVSGAGWMESRANARLGIPDIRMADGPMGIRAWTGSSAETNAANAPVKVNSTAFPAGIALAATWNPDLAALQGKVIAQEAKALGRDQMLGPTVNINRTPFWGRNFEGYGEDPYLAARMVVGYIKGMQGEGIIATVKHFAANNQEFKRRTVNVKADERTLQEIYLPAFKAAVQEAGVWSVMSAYNKVNGEWCPDNSHLLNDILKRDWGFKGYVVSDWLSTHSTPAPANGGLDLEMPGGPNIPTWIATAKNRHRRRPRHRWRLLRAREAGGGPGGRAGEAGRHRRQGAPPAARDVRQWPVRAPAAPGQRSHRYPRADGRGAAGSRPEHRAAEEQRQPFAAGRRQD